MKTEIKLDIGTEFYFDFHKNMIICYDFYNNMYWCKYDTKYGFQFHWVTRNRVEKSIQDSNRDQEVVFI